MNILFALILMVSTLLAVCVATTNDTTVNPPLPTPTLATIIIGQPS